MNCYTFWKSLIQKPPLENWKIRLAKVGNGIQYQGLRDICFSFLKITGIGSAEAGMDSRLTISPRLYVCSRSWMLLHYLKCIGLAYPSTRFSKWSPYDLQTLILNIDINSVLKLDKAVSDSSENLTRFSEWAVQLCTKSNSTGSTLSTRTCVRHFVQNSSRV